MLQSNPPRNSQLETHQNGELGRRPCGRRLIIRIDFPMPFKTDQGKSPRSGTPIFAAASAPDAQELEKSSFKWPWLHFVEVSHSSGRGLSAGFRGCRRSWGRAFAVGLAVDDELMSAMAEAVHSALAKQRFIKDSHPFLHASIRGENRGTAGVPLNQQIVEVRCRLAGELSEGEVVDDK